MSFNRRANKLPALPIKARHPKSGLELTFEPDWNSFKFNKTERLVSVSKILSKYFPFDGDKIAAKLSTTQMRPADEIKADWLKTVTLGANVNAHLKSILFENRPRSKVDQLHGDEEQYYPVAAKVGEIINNNYEVISEDVIVCSPELKLAGKIDLLCKSKHTGNVTILDISTTSSVLPSFRFGKFDSPCPENSPLSHLSNTRMSKFAVEVLLYGLMLKNEHYAKFFGKEIDERPLEYGVIQIGKSDGFINVAADFARVVPEMILPTDAVGGGEENIDQLLVDIIRKAN